MPKYGCEGVRKPNDVTLLYYLIIIMMMSGVIFREIVSKGMSQISFKHVLTISNISQYTCYNYTENEEDFLKQQNSKTDMINPRFRMN